ncbi:MAG TPA: oligosaccharide flippase family protein [Thermoanaerobaculia bacterium]|nr:oligosaccharide flippase family protein [Thermoanaerobaculia bacterium]HXK66975.1 oligosaccharide flippase family protein [Thermoanaerobaculia bacterium]
MSQTGHALYRGAMTRSLEHGITIVSGLILLPIMVTSLGTRLYGLWVLIGTLGGYFGLLDLGLTSAVQRFVSRELGRNNRVGIDRFITTSLYLFFFYGMIVFFIAGLVILSVPFFTAGPEDIRLIRELIMITAGAMAISFPIRSLRGVLNAYLRFDLLSLIYTGTTIVRTALISFILMRGHGILALALISAGCQIFQSVPIGLAVRAVHGTIPVKPRYFHRPSMSELMSYGAFSLMAQVTDLLRFHVNPFIVATFLGIPAVTPFAIADRLRRMTGGISTLFPAMLTPVFSRKDGERDEEGIRDSYFFAYRFSCFLGAFLAGLVWMHGHEFIQLWLGPGNREIEIMLYLFMGGTLFSMIQTPTVNLLYGMSHNRYYAMINGIQAIGTVILSLILVRPYGLIGVVIANSVISIFVKTGLQAWGACRILGISLLEFHVRHTIPNLALSALFFALVVPAIFVFPATSLPGIAGSAAIMTLLYFSYIIMVGFTRQQRKIVWKSVNGPAMIRTRA